MLELFFLIYLGYKNSQRAKLKGANPVTWAIFTGISWLISYFFGMAIVAFFFLKNKINFNSENLQPNDISGQLIQEFKNNPFLLFVVYFFGYGGYLIVRYTIDQRPDKDTNVHWMDKLNNDNQNR